MSKWESYQIANRLKAGNYWLQVILILTLIGGFNHLAMRHFTRIDLTENHRYALSPETKAYLNELSDPIRIYVTIPQNSPRKEEQILYRYVSQLLQEYAYQSRRDGGFLIDIEYVDIFTDLAKADALAKEFGLDQANTLLVVAGNRQRVIRPDEILTFADLRPVGFKGESTITSAIMEVTQEQSPVVYFLQGHKEAAPDDTSPRAGLSQITNELQLRNFSIQALDLTTVQAVPEDAALVIVADPKGPLLASELDKLREWITNHAGNLMIWIRPGVQANLFPLISEWGIRLSDQVVIETDPGFKEAKGTLLIRNFADHPVTDSLIQNQTFILSNWCRPVFPVAPQTVDERLSFIPLFASSQKSWSESAYQPNGTPEFDKESDIPGPVPLAVAAERKAASQLGIKVPGGRLVVFGSADLFTNQHVASLGNVSLFFNTVNWMLDRDNFLVIPPRPIESYQLAISQEQLRKTALLFLTVPGALALLGFLVHWVRQS